MSTSPHDHVPSARNAPPRERWETSLADSSIEPARLDWIAPDGFRLPAILFPGEEETPAAGPGAPPYLRAAHAAGQLPDGWDLRVRHDEPDPGRCNALVLEDLEGGATSFELVLADQPAATRGLAIDRPGALERALEGVLLDALPLAFEPGAGSTRVWEALSSLLERTGRDSSEVRVALNADPLGSVARAPASRGELDQRLAAAAALASAVAIRSPASTTLRVDGLPYHDAGATDGQELAAVMATGVAYLRALADSGMALEQASDQLLFRLALDPDPFAGIVKLRAGRRLWGRVCAACGIAAPMRLQAQLGRRSLARRDASLNLLRASTAGFAAAVGGADILTLPPFDLLSAGGSGLARRLARNTQLVLRDEAGLHRVVDPAGGSWYFERYSRELSNSAWATFQEIERRGGMAAVLADGWWALRVEESAAEADRAIAERRRVVVGVNDYAELVPGPEDAAAADPGTEGAHSLQGGGSPFPLRRPAAPFERLFDRARQLAARGSVPRVFLARLGSNRDSSARAGFTRALLAVAGIQAVEDASAADVDTLVAAFGRSGAACAVLCSSDEIYAERGGEATRALRAAGARRLLLAGRPRALEQELRAAGIDDMVARDVDVLAPLERLLDALANGAAAASTVGASEEAP